MRCCVILIHNVPPESLLAGALVFIVLSHGKEHAVYGSNGIPVKIADTKDPSG